MAETITVTGWGVYMIRMTAWLRAAQMQRKGLKMRHATLAGWREQMGSTARTWAQVEDEAQQIIAVETMARLLMACSSQEA